MKEHNREVNSLTSKYNVSCFINVVNLYNNSRSDIRIYEKVKGTVQAIADIFKYCEDESLKRTVRLSFEKYGGIFHAKWISDEDIGYDYKARIDVDAIPKKVCRQYISIAKWINNGIKAEKDKIKQRELRLSKLEIQLRKKANLSLFASMGDFRKGKH